MGCLPALEEKVGVLGITTLSGGLDRVVDAPDRLERLPRLTRLGVQAALAALAAAPRDDGRDTAIVVATSHGPVESTAEFAAGIRARGHARGNPFLFPNVLYNAVAGEVAIRGGIRGHNVTVTNGELCGAASLEIALLLLKTGRARRVVVLSVEDGGPLLGRVYGRLHRRGFGRTPPLSQLHPPAADVAVALLLDPEVPGPLCIRRARTGQAFTDEAFSDFVAQTGEGLEVSRVVRLERTALPWLGRLLLAAAGLPRGTCTLVVHRGEGGGCGAVAFEN